MIIIDRFEGDVAVVEFEEKFWNIPRAWLPTNAKEGDVISLTITIDEEETARRRQTMRRKMEELFD